ncbi:MAG: response regulator [Methylobacter sp.]|nr:MAG: response regulator [Methylobacter sp.]
MKIQARLLLLMLSKTTFTMVIALLVTSYLTRDILESAMTEKLVAVSEARYSTLNRWMETLQAQMTIFAVAPTTVQLLSELSGEFHNLGDNAQTLLQQNYLVAGRNRQATQMPAPIMAYDKVQRVAKLYFIRCHAAYNWEDMFLIDTQGNVVFSLRKETDFATNLRTGPWRDSGLARAVMPLLQDAIPGQLSFADYSQYAPRNMQAASFIALPVFDEDKQQFLGVVAIQLPISQMSELMTDKAGMGETGEVIVIGKDGWMLTDSRFSKESAILKKQLKTQVSETVLAGKTATLIAPDDRGIEILARAKPFIPFASALGDKVLWGIVAKIEHSEVLFEYYHLQRVLLFTTAGLTLLAVSLGVWGGRTITRPLIRITDALTRLANGEQISVPELKRSDEIGEIAKAAETFHTIVRQVEYEHWLGENVTLLTSAASAESSINKAAERVLHLLCDLLDVPVGAVYLLDDGRYQRVSSHGLARSNQAETSFDIGVGLLGQCVKSNQAVVLSPVPAGLTIISTGLAEFAPHELIIYPIDHKNEVLAVLELASNSSLQAKQHAFLKAATATLGLHFANLQAAEHNSLLLAETSQQAAELRASSGYARSLIEASLDPLVTIGTDGKIMDVNAATEKVTGVEREQLIGSDFSDYFTEPDKARSGFQQVFSNGFVTDFPLAIRHVTGKITDVLYNASVYLDSQGEVAGIFAAARDITDKKKADQTLFEQQQSLLRSNTELQTISEELRSQSEEMKSQNEELKSSQEELRAQQEEAQLKNQLLEKQSKQLKGVIIEVKAKAEQLQQANQYKSEFLANMSHELRTPLNSILILSKNLAENDEHNLSADQIESASVISESGTQLLTLINDILDLSKIEAGKLELQKEAFSLHDMATYLRRVFLPQAETKKLAFDIALAADLPDTVYTDRQRLTQVLSNLLTNAIKFTDAGSVNVLISQIDEDLQIEVVDTGIGIPADKLEHIFGAFQQLDGSTSRKYGGSGLGLAISRNLTYLLGGDISVTSTVGQGSRFVIQLNKLFASVENQLEVYEPAPLPAPVVASVVTAESANILLVEDDTRLLAILRRMISTLGFTPITVESAEQALVALAQTKFTGIFLDLGLPGLSGMELLRQLKADEATAGIPVFIMSGAVDTGEAKKLGALGFLKKPVTRDTIVDALKTMVQVTHDRAMPQILLIEDNPVDRRFVENLLKDVASDIVAVETGGAALQLLQTQQFALAILDLQLPDISGFDWLKQAQHHLNPPPIIIYSARELTENEVFELKGVTTSIVTKDALSDRLREEVVHALHHTDNLVTIHPAQAIGKKLLLVDDDARNLYALTKVLKSKGFVVDIAPDSIKALELLAQTTYDVLLTDIMMPQVDGYELIRRVRALGYDKLPIIAITAKAMQGDDSLCLQAGANAYLAKPVDVNALIELISMLR